ncbi:DUF565 domain-containing protein [Cyanobacterium sp. uoEpiScrs1]|uniref:DUF565 domain-containing protein n=1 Tax=Cyanobacterium sp. uoEpiScrs1 TaxID=2976343 RepID=UPI00226989B8|nr:DUF565 domain-containing protein [Cyanobacterium sp. uoEpiScrs1]
MQRTRLNTLFDNIQIRFNRLFANPWRRISLSLIGLLFGFFVGQAVSTTAGQEAYWDITIAVFLILFTETISRIAYSQIQQLKKNLWLDILNIFKIGFVYSLYFEALKLAS